MSESPTPYRAVMAELQAEIRALEHEIRTDINARLITFQKSAGVTVSGVGVSVAELRDGGGAFGMVESVSVSVNL